MQTFPWSSGRALSEETVSLFVGEQFPLLSPARITARFEGWDNEAFEINEEWIFRFPKRASGEQPLKRELALLPRLSPTLPVSAPDYRFMGKPVPAFPYVFAGWSDVEIGDPAFDFGYLWVWQGDALISEVIRHYDGEVDAGFRDRVRLDGVCAAIADCQYGVMAGIEKNHRIGLTALERAFLSDP